MLPPLVSFMEAASRLLKKRYSQRGREGEVEALLLAEDLYCKAQEVYGGQIFSPPRPFHYRTHTAATKGNSSSPSYKGQEGLLRIPAVQRTRWLARGAASAAESDPCLLYTSPSPRDQRGSRMPSSA